MMMPYDFQSEVHFLSQLAVASIFVVEVFGIRITETEHEFLWVGGLYQLVHMRRHKCFHQSGRAGLVKGYSKTIESSVIVLEIPEQDLFLCRKA